MGDAKVPQPEADVLLLVNTRLSWDVFGPIGDAIDAALGGGCAVEGVDGRWTFRRRPVIAEQGSTTGGETNAGCMNGGK